MSLSVTGVWQVDVWDQTVWADGVWREGDFVASILQGNKMFADYIERKMIPTMQEKTMTAEYVERKMIV